MAVKHPPIYSGWKSVDAKYGDMFPDRINVIHTIHGWEVWIGEDERLQDHPTFAEAITAAQRIARNR